MLFTDTYDEIYQRMKNKYEEISGDCFNEASDIAIRFKVLAGEIYNAGVYAEWLKKQMFSSTASGEYLDYLAAQRGIERKQATKAVGEITFFISEAVDHDIIIPQGTVVATSDSEPLRFVTTEDEEITAGNVLVSVYAEAENAGAESNIRIGKANIAVSVPAEIESVLNRSAFENGADMETDDELRERIKQTYINMSNGTNAAFYEQLALTVEGIAKAKVVGRLRGTGTVNVYVSGKEGQISQEILQAVQNIMSESRELNVDVIVYNAQDREFNLDVSVWPVSGYSQQEVEEICTDAFEKYLQSLPIGGKVYLSALGTKLLATGCIENYQFDSALNDTTCAVSQYFVPGEVRIAVM